MDIVTRLEQIMKDRKITEYRIAKESNIAQSTLSSVLRGRSIVSMPTLQELTLSQFFFDPENETLYPVTENQQEMLEKWLTLTPEQQKIIFDLIEYMNDRK